MISRVLDLTVAEKGLYEENFNFTTLGNDINISSSNLIALNKLFNTPDYSRFLINFNEIL